MCVSCPGAGGQGSLKHWRQVKTVVGLNSTRRDGEIMFTENPQVGQNTVVTGAWYLCRRSTKWSRFRCLMEQRDRWERIVEACVGGWTVSPRLVEGGAVHRQQWLETPESLLEELAGVKMKD